MQTVRSFYVKNPLTVVAGVVMLVFTLITGGMALQLTGSGLTDNQRNLLLITIIGLVGNAVPALLALLKSEATQNDLRNGVVKEKMKEALVENQVVTRDGPLATLEMQALHALLERNIEATHVNTTATQVNTEENRLQHGEDKDNG